MVPNFVVSVTFGTFELFTIFLVYRIITKIAFSKLGNFHYAFSNYLKILLLEESGNISTGRIREHMIDNCRKIRNSIKSGNKGI